MQSTRWNIYCLVLVLLLVTTMPCLAARELLICHEQNHPMVSTAQDGTTQGIMQGFLFSRPVPVWETVPLLQKC